MTRISSLIVATTLAILPLSAFAQQNATPAKSVAPAAITSASPSNATPSTAMPTTTATATTATGTTATGTTTTGTTATAAGTGKTETTAMPKVVQPAKSDVKSALPSTKTEVHGSNPVISHHAKASVSAKTGELPKS